MTEPKITIVPSEGLRQAHVDNVLRPLVDDLLEAMPDLTEFEFSYDRSEDYHWVKFTRNGYAVGIRSYKVLTALVDGEIVAQGVKREKAYYLTRNVRDKTANPK